MPAKKPQRTQEQRDAIPRCDCGNPGFIRKNREGVCERCDRLERTLLLKAGEEGWAGVLQTRSRPPHLRRAEFPEHWISGTAV